MTAIETPVGTVSTEPPAKRLIREHDCAKDAPANAACSRCGRGQYRVERAAIAIPGEKALHLHAATNLVSIPCTLMANHVPGDPHVAKCRGQVWAHEFDIVCKAVKERNS